MVAIDQRSRIETEGRGVDMERAGKQEEGEKPVHDGRLKIDLSHKCCFVRVDGDIWKAPAEPATPTPHVPSQGSRSRGDA